MEFSEIRKCCGHGKAVRFLDLALCTHPNHKKDTDCCLLNCPLSPLFSSKVTVDKAEPGGDRTVTLLGRWSKDTGVWEVLGIWDKEEVAAEHAEELLDFIIKMPVNKHLGNKTEKWGYYPLLKKKLEEV